MFRVRNYIKFLNLFPSPVHPKFYSPLTFFLKAHICNNPAHKHLKNHTDCDHASITHKFSQESLDQVTMVFEHLKKDDFSSAHSSLTKALSELNQSHEKTSLTKKEFALVLNACNEIGQYCEKNGSLLQAFEYYNEGFKLAEEMNIPIVEIAETYNAMGRIFLKLQAYNEAKTALEKSGSILRELPKEDVKVRFCDIQNRYMRAIISEFEGNLPLAFKLFEEIAKEIEASEIGLEEVIQKELVYQHMGNIYLSQGKDFLAFDCWDKSLNFCIGKYGENSAQSLNFCNELIRNLQSLGQFQKAAIFAEKSLYMSEKLYNKENANLIENYLLVATAFSYNNQLEEALNICNRALKIIESDLAKFGSLAINILAKIAEIKLTGQKEEEAQAYFDQGVKILLDHNNKPYGKLGDYYAFWADQLRMKTQNGNKVKDYYLKALDAYLKEETIDNAKVGAIYSHLGTLMFYEENPEKALEYFHEGLKNLKDPNMLKEVYDYIGSIYFQQGKHKEGLPYFLKTGESWLSCGDAYGNLDKYYQGIGKSYEEVGLVEEAVILYEKALEIESKNVNKDERVLKEHLKLLLDGLNRLGRKEEAIVIQKKYC